MAFVALQEDDIEVTLIESVSLWRGWTISPALSKALGDEEKSKDKPAKTDGHAEQAAWLKVVNDHAALLEQCLLPQFEKLQASEKDYETIVSIGLGVLGRKLLVGPSASAAPTVALLTKLSTAIATQPDRFPLTKLKLLTALFNQSVLSGVPPATRFRLLSSIVKFARDSDQLRVLEHLVTSPSSSSSSSRSSSATTTVAAAAAAAVAVPSPAAPALASKVEQWLLEWKIPQQDQAELYALLAQALKQASFDWDARRYLHKYLTSVSGQDKAALEAAKPAARSSVLYALSSPTEFQFDTLLSIPAVAQLANDKANAADCALFKLLQIFTNQTVEAYQQFASEQKEFFNKQPDLKADELLKKIRTLTLCTLGWEQDRLSYDLLKQKLQVVDASAVESVVIDAVSSGQIEARIDEARGEVVVHRTSRRDMDAAAWAHLKDKLASSTTNIHSLLANLHQLQSRIPTGLTAPSSHLLSPKA